MKSQELQELTGSEPLSLEEEYAMQLSWREDKDKCTFIVLDKLKVEGGCKEEDCMVGDTNIFINQQDNDAEAEIMIADPSARGKGFGEEAISLMLRYGHEFLGLKTFSAKIKFGNVASEKLFDKLGFQITSSSEVFQETTSQLLVSSKTHFLSQDWTLEEFENCED